MRIGFGLILLVSTLAFPAMAVEPGEDPIKIIEPILEKH